MARAFGYDNWNILAAKIETERPAAPTAAEDGPPTGGKTLYCSFCGKSQFEVAKLIAGPSSMICDECVGLCTDIIEHGAVLALLTEDEAVGGEAAGYPRLSAYLAARSADELRAYLAKMGRDLARMRDGLADFEAALEARAAGLKVKPVFKDRTNHELQVQVGRMTKEIGGTERVMQIVAGGLDARP